MAYNQTLGYDPNLDYNKAISQAKNTGIAKSLNTQLGNKINSQLGQLGRYSGAYNAAANAFDNSLNTTLSDLNAEVQQRQKDFSGANTGAYNAYMRAINPYGTNAEQAAALGLSNSGWSETSKANLGSAYQKSLNQNQLSLFDYLNEINRQKNNATSKINADKANAFSDYFNRNLDYTERRSDIDYDRKMQADEIARDNQRYEFEKALKNMTMDRDLDNEAYTRARYAADMSGNYSGMAKWWNQGVIDTANKNWLQQQRGY